MRTFIRNSYPRAFVRSAAMPRPPREPSDDSDNSDGEENSTKKPPVAFLPYVAGVSEGIRKVCQDFNIRTMFKSGPTLRNLLTRAKDHLLIDKQSNVVYEVPCTRCTLEKLSAG